MDLQFGVVLTVGPVNVRYCTPPISRCISLKHPLTNISFNDLPLVLDELFSHLTSFARVSGILVAVHEPTKKTHGKAMVYRSLLATNDDSTSPERMVRTRICSANSDPG